MHTRFLGGLAAALLLVSSPASVHAAQTPAPTQAGSVALVSGGVGEEERAALLAVRNDFNVRLTLAEKGSGAFLYGVLVTVSDAAGRQLAQAAARGPWLYTRLPPGQYTIAAEYEGTKSAQTVRVAEGAARDLYFYFPAPQGSAESPPAR